MTETDKLGLLKPDDEDFYDIGDSNANMDKIDTEIAGIKNPEYQMSENTEELLSGESIFTALGKLAKAVKELIIHKTLVATNAIYGHVKLAYREDITEPGTHALDAVHANPKVQGTLANDLDKHMGTFGNSKMPGHVMISTRDGVNVTSLYAMDIVEKNASITGTLANKIEDLNTKLAKIGTTAWLAQTTEALEWQSKSIPYPISSFRSIQLRQVDANGSIRSETTIPVATFKSLNTAQRVGIVSNRDDISLLSFYNGENTVAVYSSTNNLRIEVWGIY